MIPRCPSPWSHSAPIPRTVAFPHFDRLFDRSDSVLAVTEAERALVVDHHGRPERVHRVGAPLAANPSALSEPNTWVGESDYVLVLTGVDEDADDEENELARLLRMRFPDNPVGVAHNDAFCAWRHGQVTKGWPIERSSDLDRLMAWARVTVDLRPGRFFARRCVTSLLYGTPIVVPEASRAREHAERGRGGLWFADAPELAWCVEALLDPTTRAPSVPRASPTPRRSTARPTGSSTGSSAPAAWPPPTGPLPSSLTAGVPT